MNVCYISNKHQAVAFTKAGDFDAQKEGGLAVDLYLYRNDIITIQEVFVEFRGPNQIQDSLALVRRIALVH